MKIQKIITNKWWYSSLKEQTTFNVPSALLWNDINSAAKKLFVILIFL